MTRAALVGIAVGLALIMADVLTGCATSTSDVVRPAYQLAVDVCHQRELRIVRREGSSYEQDRADVEAVRRRCDAVYRGLETLGELVEEERGR